MQTERMATKAGYCCLRKKPTRFSAQSIEFASSWHDAPFQAFRFSNTVQNFPVILFIVNSSPYGSLFAPQEGQNFACKATSLSQRLHFLVRGTSVRMIVAYNNKPRF
jgi:hypothetical protein